MAKKINHFSHKEHTLKLVASKKVETSGPLHCAFCKNTKRTANNVYACESCNYYLDPLCAKLQENLAVDAHKDHQLTLVTESLPASFQETIICNACGIKISGWRYACSPCRYNVHVMCALLPQKAKFKHHKHELKLDFPQPGRQSVNCDLCGQPDHGFWGYSCNHCRHYYHVHLDCNVFKDPSSEVTTKVENQGHLKGLLTKMENMELKLKSKNVGAAMVTAGGIGVLAHGLEKIHYHREEKKNKKKQRKAKKEKTNKQQQGEEEEGEEEEGSGSEEEEGEEEEGSGSEEEDPFEIEELGSEDDSQLLEATEMIMQMTEGLAGAGEVLVSLLEGLAQC